MTEKLVEVQHLKKWFPVENDSFFSRTKDFVKAVDDVSFTIHKGETLGLVGESGCGKSTTGRALLRLLEATSGSVHINGEDIYKLRGSQLKKRRGDMQIVFQDPYASLNPRMKIRDILSEPINVHTTMTRQEKEARLQELMTDVGLDASYLDRYPHEFSGGQRQRIGIARALAVKPKLIIMDEPVSALDVSVQAQVLNLIQDLQKKYQLTYLFITHNLSVVKHISDRIAVMYLGKIVEIADKNAFFASPAHPYAQALISAIPEPNPKLKRERILLTGDVPSPVNPPSGCPFHPRCPLAMERCKTEVPALSAVAANQQVACHLYDEKKGTMSG